MQPTRTHEPRADRRREIAAAALDLLGRRGASGLTTAALADAVGLSTGPRPALRVPPRTQQKESP